MKSKVSIKGEGKLWDVDFVLKGSSKKKLNFTYSADGKTWESETFSHGNPIYYDLIIHARRGTGWKGNIQDVDTEKKYVEWKLSKTNQQHQSKRSKPNVIKIA